MLNKKWMMISLLIGTVLLCSFALTNPIYTETVLQWSLREEFQKELEETGVYPYLVTAENGTFVYHMDDVSKATEKLQNSDEDFGLPILEKNLYFDLQPDATRTDYERSDREIFMSLASLSGLEDHVEMVSGEIFPKEDVYTGVVTEEAYHKLKLVLGETVTFETHKNPDGTPLQVKITGVIKKKPDDLYFVQKMSTYNMDIFLQEDDFEEIFLTGDKMKGTVRWNVLYDYQSMNLGHIEKGLKTAKSYTSYFSKLSSTKVAFRFYPTLQAFEKKEAAVRSTFTVLQVPIYLLLLVFIFMVSKQLISMEQSEISVIMSRGGSKSQVFLIYFYQSLVIEGISLLLAIPLSYALTYFLSTASGFMSYDFSREVEIVVPKKALFYGLAAMVISMLTMIVPAFKLTKKNIISSKDKRKKLETKPFYEKFFIDVILLLISIYGLYSFESQKSVLFIRVLEGKAMDPLLYLSISLFMIGGGLFILRLFTYVIKLLFVIFKNRMSPAVYTSFLHVLRTRREQSLITVFLVVTIALGIFNASAARTIEYNAERNNRYNNGADLVFTEYKSKYDKTNHVDLMKYDSIEGADSMTKVAHYKEIDVRLSHTVGYIEHVDLYGINTKEFGETAWFDKNLIKEHWYLYLNALAENPDAVLVSSNFKDLGYELNDQISYRKDGGDYYNAVIYGFMEYFPSFQSNIYTKDTDGTFKEVPQYLIIGNIRQVEENLSGKPCDMEIWMKGEEIRDNLVAYTKENDIRLNSFRSFETTDERQKADGIFESTNGLFSIGFLTSLILLFVGFLIYWILSVRKREMQFGVLRAMGMSFREILLDLSLEQVFISGLSVLSGAFIGFLTCKLFLPLVQIAYSSADSTLLIAIKVIPKDILMVISIVFVIISICLCILSLIVNRMNITQALKLGED